MTRRTCAAFAGGLAVVAGSWFESGQPSVAYAQRAADRRLVPTEIQGRLASAFLPPGLDQDAPVTVVATLAGEPVAVAQETASRRLSRVEKDSVKTRRRGEQAAVRPSIEALGAEVLGTYQAALNGIKLRIPRRHLAALQQVPGIVSVKPVITYYPATAVGVPRIQAPVAWDLPAGVHGEGIKIAVIDSGIDYTHATYGGPGTVAAYATAAERSELPADPSLFGPDAPKVKGGFDLVGNDYDPNSADPANSPRPDSNPLDCSAGDGHGTLVASAAAGFGVTDTGQTYTGPYDATTHARSFLIGPGVAPKADLYAVRVYGCLGSGRGTRMVVEALEWAIDHDMDVVNMSLGNRFSVTTPDDLVEEAVNNAARAGIVVVAVSGNEGDIPYITRSPGSSPRAISAAASLAPATIPAATVVAGGATRRVQNSNSAPFSGATYDVYVLKTAAGGVSLGCKPNTGAADDWALPINAANVPGKLVIVERGWCSRVGKAIYGQQHGAAAVLMVNNENRLPPLEGPITTNLDDKTPYTVTIPFFGGQSSDGPALRALEPGAATFVAETFQTGLARFTSSGPRYGDGLLKPDVTAPGENIVTAVAGTGTVGFPFSGTSLATPMVAGTAALVLQAHPRWKPWQVKAAIINSGRPSELSNYRARLAGSGLVSAAAATLSSAIAFADHWTTTLNFGVQEFTSDFRGSAPIFVQNESRQDVVFDVSVTHQAGSPHTLGLSRTRVRVPARGTAEVTARLAMAPETAGDSTAFRDVAGLVTFTPASPSMNGGYALRVPYYVVPRVSSNVTATPESARVAPGESSSVLLENRSTPIAGTADVYAWGFQSKRAPKIPGNVDIHAVGAQSLADGEIVVFAITTKKAWSSASAVEFDVLVDANLDGETDFWIFSFDYGWVVNRVFDGRVGTFIVDLTTGERSVYFLAYAPTDSSSILLPVPAAAIGVTPGNPRFGYTVGSWAADGVQRDDTLFDSWAFFNPFSNAISTGAFEVVNPGDRIHVPFTVNAAEWAATPALGLMVVTQDNRNGTDEANLVRVKVQR
jgi:minor extracellular serine protease Vpr